MTSHNFKFNRSLYQWQQFSGGWKLMRLGDAVAEVVSDIKFPRRVWLMSPWPPMPPGSYLEAGHKPGGGRLDFCWLIFEHDYSGEAEVRWLRRDG